MGENPSVDRRARRIAERAKRTSTVAHVADAYLAHVGRTAKASTLKNFVCLMNAIIKPRWGTLPAVDLTRDALEAYRQDAAATPTTVNRVFAIVAAMYRRAGLATPTAGVERNRERPRDRYVSEAELARLGTALREAEAAGTVPVEAIWVTKLLLLTGCRRGEVCGLTWDAVDLDAGVLRLRDAKAGPRTVPLPAAAVVLLRGLPRIGACVIPGPLRNAPMRGDLYHRYWGKLRTAAGLPDVHAHDLRHVFASAAGAADVGPTQIRHLLGHATSAMSDRYVNANVPKLRQAADRATAGIVAALNGTVEPPVDETADGQEGDEG